MKPTAFPYRVVLNHSVPPSLDEQMNRVPQDVALALRDNSSLDSRGSPESVTGIVLFELLLNVRYSLAAVGCIIVYEWLIKYVLFHCGAWVHTLSF